MKYRIDDSPILGRTQRRRAAGVATVCALLLGGLTALSPDQPAERDPLPTSLSPLISQYQEWKALREANGSEDRTSIALRSYSGHPYGSGDVRGELRIDVRAGEYAARIVGLPADEPLDLWLVNRSDSAESSTLAGGAQDALFVGTVLPSAQNAPAQQGSLASERVRDFELDLAVAVKRGEGPAARPVLMGSLPLFERLYARSKRAAERPTLAAASVLPGGASSSDDDRLASAQLGRLVDEGERLFFQETFKGNGRTCGTCHPRANSFTIDPAFIAGLPDSDPLFVAENVPALAGLEDAGLIRARAVFGLGLDGGTAPPIFRGVLHLLSLSQSVAPPNIPFDNARFGGRMEPIERVGIGSDLNTGPIVTLRDVATAAVLVFNTKTLARVAGTDFRFPTDDELDAIEAFMLSLGRQRDLDLAGLRLTDPTAERGRQLFLATDTANGTQRAAKCQVCHANAGANVAADFFQSKLGIGLNATSNANFTTGVEDLPLNPLTLVPGDRPPIPRDSGFGVKSLVPGACRLIDGRDPVGGFGAITETPTLLRFPAGLCLEDFNVPTIVEAADTPPFFHNNSVDTIEGAVAFYASSAFKGSSAASLLRSVDTGGRDIDMDVTEIEAVAKALRVLNADENLRQAALLIGDLRRPSRNNQLLRNRILEIAAELQDARDVLATAQLNPLAVQRLDRVLAAVDLATPDGRPERMNGAQRLILLRLVPNLQEIRDSLIVRARAS